MFWSAFVNVLGGLTAIAVFLIVLAALGPFLTLAWFVVNDRLKAWFDNLKGNRQ